MLLIRDPSKVVYRAVLQSPKLSDGEVENFATMKNVAEEALRIISGSRKFMKSLIVIRNLVNNPRTPIDVSIPLLNRVPDNELKFLGDRKSTRLNSSHSSISYAVFCLKIAYRTITYFG